MFAIVICLVLLMCTLTILSSVLRILMPNCRKYVCCSEYNVVSNVCNEPTPRLVQPIGARGGDVMYFGSFCFRGELGFLKCDDICTLCGCGGCCDCDALTIVCVACVYAERVRGCDGDANTGAGAGRDVITVSAGCEYIGGTRGSGFCVLPTTC